MVKTTKQKSYKFSLIGVNIEKVDMKYGIGNVSEIENSASHFPEPTSHLDLSMDISNNVIPNNTTKISDLDISKKIPDIISFLDESKRLKNCTISMINFSNKNKLKCFWDKNLIPETVQPIGCPIKYISDRAIKSYHSEISKDKYVISESITENRTEELKLRSDPRIVIEKNGYYETDGIFCSFNCVLAYLEETENRTNPLYRNSENLLIKMYKDLIEVEDVKDIIPAPHWRLLTDFGGHLTIEQFRDCFNKVQYINHGSICCKSIGRLYEDKIKF